MSVTVQVVNSSDTLNQGRVKWNANDDVLANQGNALETQQAAHVAEGHPSLYYTKDEIAALTEDLETVKAGDILGSGEGKAIDNSSIGLNESNELEVKDGGVTDEKIPDNGITLNKLEVKIYAAILNQSSTNPPVATVTKNTLGGTPTWFRSGTGVYYLYGANLFPDNKTIVFVQGDGSKHCGAYQNGTTYANSAVSLNTRNYSTEALEDDGINISILIIVFP